MKAEFWLERWQRNEIGFHQGEINAHLQDYWDRVGLKEGGEVFVPLCGKSNDMLWLRAQGHRVLGVELSPLAVEAFFVENQLKPEVRSIGAAAGSTRCRCCAYCPRISGGSATSDARS